MNENIKKLFKLMEENPDLRVMPFVNCEVVAEDWGYWMASFGDCWVDDVCLYKDRFYWKSVSLEDLEEEIACDIDDNELFADKEKWNKFIEEQALALSWEKVIVVRIELPDYVDIGGNK